MAELYDEIGAGYRSFRHPDPRIATAILDALDHAETVVNVGAGTGSYEPTDRCVFAIEPSWEMIRQRPPGSAPCLQGDAPTRTSGSSIYPAVQNMLLAARALGLGATLTTLYLSFEKETEAALGLPPDWHSYAVIPIGYPLGRFGPVRRIELEEVVYADQWSRAYRG